MPLDDSKLSKNPMAELTDKLEQGIKDLYSSGQYADYLKAMSKFYDYSPRNSFLIWQQRPDASLVAGFNTWQKEFERHVRRGERGIKIIAPVANKQTVEMEKIDPVTQTSVKGADGKPITEEQEITNIRFRSVTVFDVSQTDGKELPEIAKDLNSKVPEYEKFISVLKEISPVPVKFENCELSGFYSHDTNSITIKNGMSEADTISTMIHEITHAKLHANENRGQTTKNTREVEVESVAYCVLQRYNVDTSAYSFGYVAGWSQDKDLKELNQSLSTIQSTAKELIESIDKKVKALEIEKEVTLRTVPGHEKLSPDEAIAMEAFIEHVLAEERPQRVNTDTTSKSLTIERVQEKLSDYLTNVEKLDMTKVQGVAGLNAMKHRLEHMANDLNNPDTAIVARYPELSQELQHGITEALKAQNPDELKPYLQALNQMPENYLKSAEMSVEQNYDQIDGIINNEPEIADNGDGDLDEADGYHEPVSQDKEAQERVSVTANRGGDEITSTNSLENTAPVMAAALLASATGAIAGNSELAKIEKDVNAGKIINLSDVTKAIKTENVPKKETAKKPPLKERLEQAKQVAAERNNKNAPDKPKNRDKELS